MQAAPSFLLDANTFTWMDLHVCLLYIPRVGVIIDCPQKDLFCDNVTVISMSWMGVSEKVDDDNDNDNDNN